MAGVFADKVVEKVALVLSELGVERAFVVHGDGGLDEISLSGETTIGDVRRDVVQMYQVTPEDFGLERAPLDAITGGDAARNAEIIRAIFSGERGPRHDIVVANSAAAIVASGRANDFLEGAQLAATAIDSGEAMKKLDALIAFTHK